MLQLIGVLSVLIIFVSAGGHQQRLGGKPSIVAAIASAGGALMLVLSPLFWPLIRGYPHIVSGVCLAAVGVAWEFYNAAHMKATTAVRCRPDKFEVWIYAPWNEVHKLDRPAPYDTAADRGGRRAAERVNLPDRIL